MKTVLTVMIALFTVATTLGQKIVKKETIVITDTQDGDTENTIVELSKKLQESIDDNDSLNKKDIKVLKELLAAIGDNVSEHSDHKVIVKKGDATSSSFSYAISIDSDGEVTTHEGGKEINIEELKEKLKEVSEVIHDSEDIKVIIKKLGDGDIIIEEKEEKKTKKKKQ